MVSNDNSVYYMISRYNALLMGREAGARARLPGGPPSEPPGSSPARGATLGK